MMIVVIHRSNINHWLRNSGWHRSLPYAAFFSISTAFCMSAPRPSKAPPRQLPQSSGAATAAVSSPTPAPCPPLRCTKKLTGFGLDIAEQEIVSATRAALIYLQ
jgi:hypothetical protein